MRMMHYIIIQYSYIAIAIYGPPYLIHLLSRPPCYDEVDALYITIYITIYYYIYILYIIYIPGPPYLIHLLPRPPGYDENDVGTYSELSTTGAADYFSYDSSNHKITLTTPTPK